jgi:hypothetical protein
MAVSRPQTTDLAKLLEEYRRAFNARDLDAWVQLLDPEIEIEVDSFTLRGIEAPRGFAEGIDKIYPGAVSELQRVVAMSSDTVVTKSRLVNPNADASDAARGDAGGGGRSAERAVRRRDARGRHGYRRGLPGDGQLRRPRSRHPRGLGGGGGRVRINPRHGAPRPRAGARRPARRA